MIYNRVSGKTCVARLYNSFNIDYSDWESRSPQWINQALGELNAYNSLEKTRKTETVSDYIFKLPCDIKVLAAIEYEGCRLPRIDRINEAFSSDVSLQFHPLYKYELNNDGWAITTFEDGEVIIHYRRLPLEYDATTRLYFPYVPDNEKTLRAIEWYLLMSILQRGHKVHGYSLDTKSPYTNPATQWEIYRKKARNSINQMDSDEREQISRLIRTFIVNYDNYYSGEFNNTKDI